MKSTFFEKKILHNLILLKKNVDFSLSKVALFELISEHRIFIYALHEFVKPVSNKSAKKIKYAIYEG